MLELEAKNVEIFFFGDARDMFDQIAHAVSERRPAALILLGDNAPEWAFSSRAAIVARYVSNQLN